MEQRSLEKREKLGLTGAKPQGSETWRKGLYGLKTESTPSLTPELLDAATDEVQAGYQETLARPAATPNGLRYWSRSNSNPSELGVPKGGGFCSRLLVNGDSDNEITTQFEKQKTSKRVSYEQQSKREAQAEYEYRIARRAHENEQSEDTHRRYSTLRGSISRD